MGVQLKHAPLASCKDGRGSVGVSLAAIKPRAFCGQAMNMYVKLQELTLAKNTRDCTAKSAVVPIPDDNNMAANRPADPTNNLVMRDTVLSGIRNVAIQQSAEGSKSRDARSKILQQIVSPRTIPESHTL